MAISALPQAPYRQDRKIFPTPLVTDVLFSEIRDCTRTEFPEYGTPHPNANKWPYHKLIFIKPVDIERNEVFEFFYAAERENQDLYNFSSGYRNVIGNVGGREFRVVLREYVTPRAEFDPLYPAFGAGMPDVPEGTFEGIDYLFFDKQQKKIEQAELDSLYVAEVHTYVEKAFLDYKISYTNQIPDLVPDKFRPTLSRTTIEGIEEGLAELPTLLEGQILASQDQLNPDVKLVKTISQTNPTGSITLDGSRSYVETTKATTEERYSTTELEAETGLYIVQSIATPLGNGDYVRETVRVDSWPKLTSSNWDPTLNVQVASTTQFVSPEAINLSKANTSYSAVNEDRVLETVEEPPDSALSGYTLSMPSSMDITLPRVLKSISVVWSSDTAQGKTDGEWSGYTQGPPPLSLGGSEGDSCQSSLTLRPELVIDIEQPWGSNIPVTAYVFFIHTSDGSVTEDSLMSRIGQIAGQSVQRWPLFRPVSHTIILQGGKASVVAGATGTASKTFGTDSTTEEEGKTITESYDVSISLSSTNTPPTIHGDLTLGETEREDTVNAIAQANWIGTNFPSINAYAKATKTVKGVVSPESLPATNPSKIPTSGYYLMSSSVEPYKWGWAKCSAVILDASNLD